MKNKKGMTPSQAAKIRAKKGIAETKLQRLRVKKGMSQYELSVVSGVPTRRIQYYEQTAGAINGARLEALCRLSIALDCKLEDILESNSLIEKLRKTK